MYNPEKTLARLRELMGYVQNGSSAIVTIFQDDATQTWILKVRDGIDTNNKEFLADSMEEVIRVAYEGTTRV